MRTCPASLTVMGTHDHHHDHPGHDHPPHAHGAHGHAHGGQRGHGHGPTSETRLLIALAATATFMVAEVIGGIVSGSLALIADAGHMLADAASLALAYAGTRLARRPADDRRSFGYGRLEVLAAFVNGVTLLLLAGWIAIEAMIRLTEPGEVLGGTMLAVAVLGLLVNAGCILVLHGGAGHDINVSGALAHVIGDLLGSVAAIAAAIVILTTGWTPIDPLLSVLVAGLIVRSGWVVTRRAAHVLLQGTPEGVDAAALAAAVAARPEVAGVSHVHVWAITMGRMVATLHVTPAPGHDGRQAVAAARQTLHAQFGIDHVTIETDPPGAGRACPHGADAL